MDLTSDELVHSFACMIARQCARTAFSENYYMGPLYYIEMFTAGQVDCIARWFSDTMDWGLVRPSKTW